MVNKERDLPIREVPDSVEIPPEIERAGVVSHPTNFTAKVKDDQGNNVIQPQVTGSSTTTIPQSQQSLTNLSKGQIVNSITWFALFWLRMIKKAIHFGKEVIVGEKK